MVFFILNKIVEQGISQQIHFDVWCCVKLIHILLWKILLHDFIKSEKHRRNCKYIQEKNYFLFFSAFLIKSFNIKFFLYIFL